MYWYIKVLQNYANFEGRARRREYWYFALFTFLFSVLLLQLDVLNGLVLLSRPRVGPNREILEPLPVLGVFGLIYKVVMFLPGLAVLIRRLHDGEKSGWWALLELIPLLGHAILLYFTVQPGTRGPNEFGPDPIKSEERGSFDEHRERERNRPRSEVFRKKTRTDEADTN